jgi:hypothetical protein
MASAVQRKRELHRDRVGHFRREQGLSMATLPLVLFDKTSGRVYQLGTLDGVDTTGMQDASPLPAGSGTAIELEVQYGDKAVPSFGVTAYGGATTSAPRPGQAQNVVGMLTPNGDIVITCDPPANAATVAPWLYIYLLAGVNAQPPVSASGTLITFTAPGPGTWTPTVWVIGADGVSLPATGAAVVIGTPSTTARTLSNLSGSILLDLLEGHTYMITPISVTGYPVVRVTDLAGADITDFDGSTALPVTIPAGVNQVRLSYWSDLPGSIDFEVTEAGVEAPATVTNDAVVTGTLAVGSVLTVQKAVYSDGTTGDYGAWSVQDFPDPGVETTVGTGTTLLLLAGWEGHDIQWTQFWRIADKSGAHGITQGPIGSGTGGSFIVGALKLGGQSLTLGGQTLTL